MKNVNAAMLSWPHVTPEIAQRATEEYQREFGKHDPNLLECPGWWLWTRTRELSEMNP